MPLVSLHFSINETVRIVGYSDSEGNLIDELGDLFSRAVEIIDGRRRLGLVWGGKVACTHQGRASKHILEIEISA